jgi:hypothetical protein
MQDNVAQGDVGQEAQSAKKPIRKERYILNPKDGRACFNVYKEVFVDKKKKAVDKLCRSSRNGFRSLLYKEVYKDDVLFLFLFQTAKHSEQVVLSKKYLENQEENLNFFKKIKDICNPSNIFADFSVYEKE